MKQAAAAGELIVLLNEKDQKELKLREDEIRYGLALVSALMVGARQEVSTHDRQTDKQTDQPILFRSV
jgi:hypothetical protein